jgi:hypothetical protein
VSPGEFFSHFSLLFGENYPVARLLLQTVKNNDSHPGGRKGEGGAGLRKKDNLLN